MITQCRDLTAWDGRWDSADARPLRPGLAVGDLGDGDLI
jgi:hypothetical protein